MKLWYIRNDTWNMLRYNRTLLKDICLRCWIMVRRKGESWVEHLIKSTTWLVKKIYFLSLSHYSLFFFSPCDNDIFWALHTRKVSNQKKCTSFLQKHLISICFWYSIEHSNLLQSFHCRRKFIPAGKIDFQSYNSIMYQFIDEWDWKLLRSNYI